MYLVPLHYLGNYLSYSMHLKHNIQRSHMALHYHFFVIKCTYHAYLVMSSSFLSVALSDNRIALFHADQGAITDSIKWIYLNV